MTKDDTTSADEDHESAAADNSNETAQARNLPEEFEDGAIKSTFMELCARGSAKRLQSITDQLTQYPQQASKFYHSSAFRECLYAIPLVTGHDHELILSILMRSEVAQTALLNLLPREPKIDSVRTMPPIFLRNLSIVLACAESLELNGESGENEISWLNRACSLLIQLLEHPARSYTNDSLLVINGILDRHDQALVTISFLRTRGIIPALLKLINADTTGKHISQSNLLTVLKKLLNLKEFEVDILCASKDLISDLLASGKASSIVAACEIVRTQLELQPRLGQELILFEGFLEEVDAEAQDQPANVRHALLHMLSAASFYEPCKAVIKTNCLPTIGECIEAFAMDQLSFTLALLVSCKLGLIDASLELDQRKNLCRLLVTALGEPTALVAASETLMIFATHRDLLESFLELNIIQIFSKLDNASLQRVSYPAVVMLAALMTDHGANEVLQGFSTGANSKHVVSPRESVRTRISCDLHSELIPLISRLIQIRSANTQEMLDKVLCYMADIQAARTPMIQIGVLKYLINRILSAANIANLDEAQSIWIDGNASHAISRILITTNPNMILNGSGIPARTVVHILCCAIRESLDNDLKTFEALMALTNLSSLGEEECRAVTKHWQIIVEASQSSNFMIRRATTELICNMVVTTAGAYQFIAESTDKVKNLAIILRSVSDSDFATQRAGLGALAALTCYQEVNQCLSANSDAMDYLEKLIANEQEEIFHRCLVIYDNLITSILDDGGFGMAQHRAVAAMQEVSVTAKLRSHAILSDPPTETQQTIKSLCEHLLALMQSFEGVPCEGTAE